MGTYARVLIYGGTNEQAERAFSEIGRLDNLLSDYNPSSEISEINNQAGIKPVKVSPQVSQILKYIQTGCRGNGRRVRSRLSALSLSAFTASGERVNPR